MKSFQQLLLISLVFMASSLAHAMNPVDELLQEFRHTGVQDFSADAGKAFWNKSFKPAGADKERRCASCHTTDIRQPGKHVTTGKEIEPLAPSVTSKRLTNPAKMRKWLARNCKWTLGRECTAQEKGDVLMFLQSQ